MTNRATSPRGLIAVERANGYESEDSVYSAYSNSGIPLLPVSRAVSPPMTTVMEASNDYGVTVTFNSNKDGYLNGLNVFGLEVPAILVIVIVFLAYAVSTVSRIIMEQFHFFASTYKFPYPLTINFYHAIFIYTVWNVPQLLFHVSSYRKSRYVGQENKQMEISRSLVIRLSCLILSNICSSVVISYVPLALFQATEALIPLLVVYFSRQTTSDAFFNSLIVAIGIIHPVASSLMALITGLIGSTLFSYSLVGLSNIFRNGNQLIPVINLACKLRLIISFILAFGSGELLNVFRNCYFLDVGVFWALMLGSAFPALISFISNICLVYLIREPLELAVFHTAVIPFCTLIGTTILFSLKNLRSLDYLGGTAMLIGSLLTIIAYFKKYLLYS